LKMEKNMWEDWTEKSEEWTEKSEEEIQPEEKSE
jgi:hypothetical protein